VVGIDDSFANFECHIVILLQQKFNFTTGDSP